VEVGSCDIDPGMRHQLLPREPLSDHSQAAAPVAVKEAPGSPVQAWLQARHAEACAEAPRGSARARGGRAAGGRGGGGGGEDFGGFSSRLEVPWPQGRREGSHRQVKLHPHWADQGPAADSTAAQGEEALENRPPGGSCGWPGRGRDRDKKAVCEGENETGRWGLRGLGRRVVPGEKAEGEEGEAGAGGASV